MLTILVVIFIAAYAAIALEHPMIGINKSASALLGAGLALIGYLEGIAVYIV